MPPAILAVLSLALAARMRNGYDGLFDGHDVAAGIKRAEPVSRMMLVLTASALAKFKETEMADPNPIDPTFPPIKPPEEPVYVPPSDPDSGGNGQTKPPPPPRP